ncbi:13413_t:CDS:2 [Cetraspora pellucida]|uniref:13413_t:CDS:1 n=1 Tax=Cetraspora pellucida TaxID=1433469 RepID=A0A9N9IKS8_9GLOM|nr:13413_t:CDS:2 [Cetraspora pellucida]
MSTIYPLPQHCINSDGSVNLPFRHAVKTYINLLPLFTNCKLKKTSRFYVNENVKTGLITLKQIEGAIDYLVWKTSKGQIKTTNRLDDILELTNKGRNHVIKIKQHMSSDLTVWRWFLFCDGSNNCEKACSGLGECKSKCSNFYLKNNLKNNFDMHKCAVQIIMKVMLSNIKEPLPIQLVIKGTHRSLSIPAAESKLGRINLSLQTRDMAIAARHGHHTSGMEIALKVLFPYNNANEINLRHVHKSGKDLCNEQQLKRLLKEMIIDYMKMLASSKNSLEYYYQLTLSDELWLSQGHDYGQFCFEIDGKYDLYNEGAPVLSMVIKDQAGYSSSLAFGFSNKENHYTIQLAVQAVKANIPCNNPHYGWGFKRIRECISYWNPLAIMDKHRLTKLALQNLVRGTILCWFHIMSTLEEHLQQWKVDWNLQYPIALVFKIVGQSKSDNEIVEMRNEYKKFIYFLLLDDNVKNLLIHDLEMNWICDEWRQGFIDGGRELQMYALTRAKLMTTNNLTERMNKTIESWCSGTQTVLSFIEHLYGVKFIKKSLVQSELDETLSDTGLATYWNMRTIEYKQMPFKKLIDQKHRINQGCLYALLDFIIPISEQTNYMFVKKQSTIFCSSYNNHYINISTEVSEQIDKMIIKLINRDNINIPVFHYLINISTNECICYDYVWNGSFRDACKHIYAARIYIDLSRRKLQKQDIKEKLVEHFKNKERAIASENKNYLIYNKSNYTCDTENINAYDDEYDDSFAESAKYAQSDEYKELPPSVHRRNTTRIRNKHKASTQSRSLEELFLEQGCDWNPKEFTNAVITKRLCLNDNSVENGVKLYQWISNRKIWAKNAKET